MRFQGQLPLAVLAGLILLAAILSVQEGIHLSWILPVLLLFQMPREMRESRVVVDKDGVNIGGAGVLAWVEVESLANRGWTRAVFSLKDGTRKNVSTLDWPPWRRQRFYALLARRGIGSVQSPSTSGRISW